MKHRMVIQRLRANIHRVYTRQVRPQSTLSKRLSIIASPKATQGQVLDELSRHALKAAGQACNGALGGDSVAVLASKDFTSWLDDENFMRAFLETLFKPTDAAQANHPSLHVLSGIVDGLSPNNLSGEPHTGFSVLCGPADNTLPGLWAKEGFAGAGQDTTACVSFVTGPLANNAGALEVTLPSANTVFQNGRRSTLYASRWDTGGEGSIVLHTKSPKTTQCVIGKGGAVGHTSPMMPLLPLTPPRKIVAGLGNIVRQVEVDGSAAPASRELEDIIPKIFEERAQRDLASSLRPIGVWCWVIPPHHVEAKKFDKLNLFEPGSPRAETDIVLDSMELFSELLSSGCRLHKILSGGGGWGLKQGLLSLDPETSFSLPGQDDDMEMFIRSFEERNSADPTVGLATPGSSLLFCVEPQLTDTKALSNRLLAPAKTLAFGVTPNADYMANPSSHSDAVRIIDDHFGISSASGLFLRNIPEFAGFGRTNEDGGTSQRPFTTKVDVPGAYFCV